MTELLVSIGLVDELTSVCCKRRNPTQLFVTLCLALPTIAAATAAYWMTRPTRVEVAGASMAPTLLAGDRLVIARLGPPRVGHLVAVPQPGRGSTLLVKRVTSIDGNRIEVRGDNPKWSTDSRDFGSLPAESVKGRVIYRYSPAQRAGWLPGQRGPARESRSVGPRRRLISPAGSSLACRRNDVRPTPPQ